MINSKINIEQLINSNYVKYDRMIEIVKSAFVGSSAQDLNIYIDLYSILKVLYKENEIYNIKDYSTVSSCIVNMCAHYREFFRTRFKVETVFYIVYGENCDYVNKKFYPEYNGKNMYAMNNNKVVKDMIFNNLELLKTLSPYLPDIHFINVGDMETGVVMYDLICRSEANRPDIPNMIITKDPFVYQLAARDNVIIVRPKKFNGVDSSYYINKYNLIDIYLKERKSTHRPNNIISPYLFSLILTLSSLKERNIKMLYNIKTAINLIDKGISSYTLLNGYNTSFNIWDGLDLGNTKCSIGKTTFEYRFRALDIMYLHEIYFNNEHISNRIYLDVKNLYDPEAVKYINNEYFANNPLDLNRL